MPLLSKLTISNFKSIRSQTLELRPLNVFIGSNGSGKSNLIQVFRFLKEVVAGNVVQFTATKGGASAILHFGGRRNKAAGVLARAIDLKVGFDEGYGPRNGYEVRLRATDSDSFAVDSEDLWIDRGIRMPSSTGVDVVHDEPPSNARESWNNAARDVLPLISAFRIYHFHDTSETAAVKGSCAVDDNRYLREDGGNLAAFLYWLQEKEPAHLGAITDAVRQVAPFFERFQLEPSKLAPDRIRLEWMERGDDAHFNASALSDGSLRFMCLAALLLQPVLPPLILLDEPELGLHPAAVVLLASLLASASTRSQLVVATQSSVLIDQLRPEDVWAVDRRNGESVFRWLGGADMSGWLDEYGLGELWRKNLLGARP